MRKGLILKIFAIVIVSFLFVFFLLPVMMTLLRGFPEMSSFFSDEFYIMALLRTIRIGLMVTLISAVISYPISIFITSLRRFKAFFISLVLFPLMTNTVVRTFGWIVILGKDGVVNKILVLLGFKPVRLLYTDLSVVVGLLHLFLPLMILPLVGAMENIDEEMKESARNLGAGPIRVFFDITFPMSLKGLTTGSLLVFVGSITSYITPKLLGGPRLATLSMLLYQKAMVVMDWEGASMVALVMTLMTTGFLVLSNRMSKVVEG